MKKRVISIALALCLVVTLGLTGCAEGKPYEKYNLADYIKLSNYKGIEVEKIKTSVSDEEVQTKIKANLDAAKETKTIKSGKVKKADTVNIDYKGKIDGKAFDGGTAEGHELEIGSNSFIEGFEEGLIGKKVGTTHDLKLKFPKEYQQNPDLAGKDVVFTVKINSIVKQITPKYDEKWIAANSKVKTKKAYEKQIKDEIFEEKEMQNKNTQLNGIFAEVVEKSKVIKYPEDEINEFIERTDAQFESAAKESSVDVSQIRQQQGLNSEKEYKDQIKKAAEETVKAEMCIYYIADKEEITIKEDEIKKQVANIEKNYTKGDAAFKKETGMDMNEYVENMLIKQKIADLLLDNAKMVDKKTTDKDTKKEEKATKESNKKSDKKDSKDNNKKSND